ncbi:MAG: TonB family protein [Paludibacter sp.]|nr:TonB family protein [Paludibacter sp.]
MHFSKITTNWFLKPSLFLALFLAFTVSSNSQTNQNLQVAKDSVYTFAEKMPQFPGGEKELVSFLNKTISYPVEAQKKNESGKVIVQFVVSKTGKVEGAKILKGVSASLDSEALRVIGLLPDWTPGEQNGEKVSIYRILPITFKGVSPEDAWIPNEKTLVIIDNVKMPENFNVNILNPEKLASITVFKPFPKEEKSKLMSKYGKQAADGVILITSKKGEIEYAYADTTINKVKDDGEGCKETTYRPEFQGGVAKMMTYIADSIQYPFSAKETKTQGKVIVRFLVDSTGKISEPQVIRSVDYFLDREAMRIIKSMPNWIPGAKCGQKTSFYVTVPVNFKLDIPKAEKQWEPNAKTIILQDGVRLPSSFNLDWLNYLNLTSYKVLQPTTKEITKELVSKYGRDAVNGVVLMESRK